MMWVMATLAVAMSLQLARMPLWILVIAIAPFLWRVGAELRRCPRFQPSAGSSPSAWRC